MLLKSYRSLSYRVNTEFVAMECCQGEAASLIYTVMKLNEQVEIGVKHSARKPENGGLGTHCIVVIINHIFYII